MLLTKQAPYTLVPTFDIIRIIRGSKLLSPLIDLADIRSNRYRAFPLNLDTD